MTNKFVLSFLDADYEKAVHTTSFGKFNVVLMSVAFWSCIACMFQNTSISYVFPAAQCDLKLTENNKGFLNASTFIGKYQTKTVAQHINKQDAAYIPTNLF